MRFKIPIMIWPDKMEPAYDLAFRADVITFRTHEKLRRPGELGESHFYIWDGGLVQCHDVESPDLENEFVIPQLVYDRLVKMYLENLPQ